MIPSAIPQLSDATTPAAKPTIKPATNATASGTRSESSKGIYSWSGARNKSLRVITLNVVREKKNKGNATSTMFKRLERKLKLKGLC